MHPYVGVLGACRAHLGLGERVANVVDAAGWRAAEEVRMLIACNDMGDRPQRYSTAGIEMIQKLER